MRALESGATDEEVEEQFTMQLEQLIKQCDDELSLIPKMAEWKPWEVPAGHKASSCSSPLHRKQCSSLTKPQSLDNCSVQQTDRYISMPVSGNSCMRQVVRGTSAVAS
jgi:hypothetical protein